MAPTVADQGEFFIMLVIYFFLFVMIIFFWFLKTGLRGCHFWTAYDTFSLFALIYSIIRIFCISFLIGLKWGYLPWLVTQQSQPFYYQKETTGYALVILYELFFTFGLYSLIGTFSILWFQVRKLIVGYKQSFIYLIFIILVNAILIFVSFIMLMLQYAVNIRDDYLTFINASNFWISFVFCIFAFFCAWSGIELEEIVYKHFKRNPNSQILVETHKYALILRNYTLIAVIFIIIRAVSLVIDSAAYNFISSGSPFQTIWNLLFKYTLWVVPEFFIILFVGLAIYYGFDLNTCLKISQAKVEEGVYTEVADVETEDLESFLKKEKQKTGEYVPTDVDIGNLKPIGFEENNFVQKNEKEKIDVELNEGGYKDFKNGEDDVEDENEIKMNNNFNNNNSFNNQNQNQNLNLNSNLYPNANQNQNQNQIQNKNENQKEKEEKIKIY